MSWTDPTIVERVTHIKKIHIDEIRAAIDNHVGARNPQGVQTVHNIATSTQDGFMSASDKSIFNNLVATAGTVLAVNGTAPIVSSGGTAPYISITPAASGTAGSMSATHYIYLQGLIDKTKGVYSINVEAPIVNTGTATEPILNINEATQSVKGAMSSEDKTKLDGLISIPINGIILFNPPDGNITTYFDIGNGLGKTSDSFDLSNYVLCDGQNNTPDLRNRFIIGAGAAYGHGNIGGEATHILTIDEMPEHSHTADIKYMDEAHQSGNPWGSGGDDDIEGTYKFTTEPAGKSQPHNNLPPYIALHYIMRKI